MNKRNWIRRTAALSAFVLLFATAAGILAEEAPNDDAAAPATEEPAVEEIRPLIENSQVTETEGMGLEELTEAFSETAMSDYADSYTGFFMQYPAFFIFSEDQEASVAYSEDGKAALRIESMPVEGELTEEELKKAIQFEMPDAEILRNEQNGCLRVDRTNDRGQKQTDLYLITGKSFHHVTILYPADEEGLFAAYISYMINTMEIIGSDQG